MTELWVLFIHFPLCLCKFKLISVIRSLLLNFVDVNLILLAEYQYLHCNFIFININIIIVFKCYQSNDNLHFYVICSIYIYDTQVIQLFRVLLLLGRNDNIPIIKHVVIVGSSCFIFYILYFSIIWNGSSSCVFLMWY